MKRFKKSYFYVIPSLFVSALILFSCQKNYNMDKVSDEVEYTGDWALPLVKASLSLEEIIEEYDTEGYTFIDDEFLIHFTYSDSLISEIASDLVTIKPQNFLQIYIDSEIDIPAFQGSGVGDTLTYYKTKNYKFAIENGGKLDSIYLKQGDLNLSVTSQFHHLGILTITSDYIKKDGVSFEEVVQISSADGSFTMNELIDVAGYDLYFDNSQPDTTLLPVNFELKLINSGAPINAGETCEITMNFSNLDFFAAFGYIGDYQFLSDSGEIELEFFEEFPEGNIRFENPQFIFNIRNSIGVPVQGELFNLSGTSTESGQTVDIAFDPGYMPFTVEAPSLAEIGQTKSTVFTVSGENSNIPDAIEIKPNRVTYGVRAMADPGSTTERNHFVLDTSRIDVDYEVVVPLWLSASGLSYEVDSMDFDFEEDFGDASDNINKLIFRVEVDNWLPLDVDLQVYFLDDLYTLVDSLFESPERILGSDPENLDADGKITSPENKVTEIVFEKDDLDKLKPAKYMKLSAALATTDQGQPPVKIYSFYTIDFNLAIRASFRLNSRD